MELGIAKDIAIFLAGLVVGPLAYLAKRKIERRSEHEDLELNERLLKINKELSTQKLTTDDLKKLRTLVFGRLRDNAPANEAESSTAAITGRASDEIITQAEMNRASLEEYEKASLELRHVVERLQSILHPTDAKSFQEAQLAWLEFRKSQVEFAGELYEGGTIAPLVRNVEAQALTEARVRALRSLYDELKAR